MQCAITHAAQMTSHLKTAPWTLYVNPTSLEWSTRNNLSSNARYYLCYDRAHDNLTSFFVQVLKKVEQKYPVPLKQSGEIERDRMNLLKTIRENATIVQKTQTETPSAHLSQLDRQITALHYRIENKEKVDMSRDYSSVEQRLITWKGGSALNDFEKRIIHKLQAYPKFLELLSSDPDLENEFFTWSVTHRLSVSIFIQYPDLQQRIHQAGYLIGRLNRYDDKRLSLQKGDHKQPSILFGNKRTISVLDPDHEINFADQQKATVQQIFNDFASRDYTFGRYEMFEEGIVPHNSRHFEIDRDDWLHELKDCRVVSTEKAQEMFHTKSLDGKMCGVAAYATRLDRDRTYNPDGTHACMILIFPHKSKKDHYKLVPIGDFAPHFPRSFLAKLLEVVKSYNTVIATPDPNFFEHAREHTTYLVPMDEAPFKQFTSEYREEIRNVRNGAVPFQVASECCTKKVKGRMKRAAELAGYEIEDLFTMPYLELEPAFLGWSFKLMQNRSPTMQRLFVQAVSLPLGSWRSISYLDKDGVERVFSLMKSEEMRTLEICHPGKLFENQREGKVGYEAAKKKQEKESS